MLWRDASQGGRGMTTRRLPSEEEVLGYFQSLSNWGRWGDDDQRGTLNLVTDEKRRQAASLVKDGLGIGCARPVSTQHAVDQPITPVHFMVESGEVYCLDDDAEWTTQHSMDYFGMAIHGPGQTHLDALCHQFWRGQMYNGRPASVISSGEKATFGAVDGMKDGLVTKGVLLDLAKLRDVLWYEPGEAAYVEDLEAAEAAHGVKVEEGDALLIRFGWTRRRNMLGPVPRDGGRAGLHASCLPWLHERGISVLACDSAQEVRPTGYDGMYGPIHSVGQVAMGLWLIDNADFDALAEVCERVGRYEFMFTLAPLHFPLATGSPINPIALL